ncbi:hypothetical protein AAIH49_21685 [Pseudomonas aeruginosa]|jgi:hypothetical protein|uniref:Lipoprotein n=3 Tax=Pseudomonas aeruginosa TaxID=287 RepID=A0A7M3A8R3_PSEAI|nr:MULTISPECIES: hypothetical protein [Pseudomonas aeruginosa group]ARG90352.1 hypothetical protein E613_63420 [Pseudomonas aeruginosa]AUA80230.1 hypothetical protein CWI21_30360 [Pseudomonas aeruginosa]AUB04860.1 hypothetical protein CWI20_30360 [Pseudomonas aeruginosa]AYZ45370.1 hypothetical protein EGY29_10170 [Pseudomonas aeruginosa]EIU1490358.1 hypothetical protein [Pseudomonas aeruginosa]
MRSLLTILAVAVLAGCGGSEPFPRVDFPMQPGNYLQFYTQSGHPVVEFVQVDQRREAHSVQSGSWHGKVPIAQRMTNQTALLQECGLVTFREDDSEKVPVSYSRYNATEECPFKPFPALWTRVGRVPANN